MHVSPIERLIASARDNPKPFAIGGAATLASVVLLVLLARSGGTDTKVDAGGPVTAEDAAVAFVPSATVAVAPEVDAQIAAALAAIDRGDYGTGIAQLKELEKTQKGRANPSLHRALEKAYTATKNTKDALRQTELLLAADPKAASDLKLAENVRNAAVRDAPDEAFALLEGPMGNMGLDILYDIAYGKSGAQYPQAAERARRALQKGDVRKAATPGLLVALDLRSVKGCDAIRYFSRAREHGDSRALDILAQYQSTRGCGFANAKDCWPCMRKDAVLIKTMQGIEQRMR